VCLDNIVRYSITQNKLKLTKTTNPVNEIIITSLLVNTTGKEILEKKS
jgi:hypothetical protein